MLVLNGCQRAESLEDDQDECHPRHHHQHPSCRTQLPLIHGGLYDGDSPCSAQDQWPRSICHVCCGAGPGAVPALEASRTCPCVCCRGCPTGHRVCPQESGCTCGDGAGGDECWGSGTPHVPAGHRGSRGVLGLAGSTGCAVPGKAGALLSVV